ncbi:MAG: ubiquitin carboxyl-terminal hydrolase [Amoebophilaceae bacterium]|nr:ubiquitin carboxyl-terminal hydrolase [Amoebophilaceae bacterium]
MENITLYQQYDKKYIGVKHENVSKNYLSSSFFASNKGTVGQDGVKYEFYSTIAGLLPDIVVVEDFRGADDRGQVVRFNYDAPAMVKINPKFFKPPVGPVYLSLEAFMVNTGGHWFSYITKEHQWYCANDGTVSMVTENEFKNLSIVKDILFYKKPTSAPNGANIPTIPAACGSCG